MLSTEKLLRLLEKLAPFSVLLVLEVVFFLVRWRRSEPFQLAPLGESPKVQSGNLYHLYLGSLGLRSVKRVTLLRSSLSNMRNAVSVDSQEELEKTFFQKDSRRLGRRVFRYSLSELAEAVFQPHKRRPLESLGLDSLVVSLVAQ